MARRSEFVDYLAEQLASLGEISAKSMFGGWGIYHEGRMFGLVADETFYLKVDAETRADFERERLQPFRFKRTGGRAVLSYWEAPPAALDDRHLLCQWARKGIAAAARAAQKKPLARRRPEN